MGKTVTKNIYELIFLLLLLLCSSTIAVSMTDFKVKCPNLFLLMQCNGLPDNSPVCANNMISEEAITIGIPWMSTIILFILFITFFIRCFKTHGVNPIQLIIINISFIFIFFLMAITYSNYFRKARPCKQEKDFENGSSVK